MIAIPAIDLRSGACVQLVGGSYDDERIRLPDPLAVAEMWETTGFRRLHVVDLDAATGAGSNEGPISAILSRRRASVQVGGGVRSKERIAELLAAGAEGVVVGTRALEDRSWLEAQAGAFPDRLIVAVDVREGRVAIKGWSATLTADAPTMVSELGHLPIAGFLVTAIDVEGKLGGPDLDLIEKVVSRSGRPVIASGGIATVDDLRQLASCGAESAVIGMALYTGALDAAAVAQEFGG